MFKNPLGEFLVSLVGIGTPLKILDSADRVGRVCTLEFCFISCKEAHEVYLVSTKKTGVH